MLALWKELSRMRNCLFSISWRKRLKSRTLTTFTCGFSSPLLSSVRVLFTALCPSFSHTQSSHEMIVSEWFVLQYEKIWNHCRNLQDRTYNDLHLLLYTSSCRNSSNCLIWCSKRLIDSSTAMTSFLPMRHMKATCCHFSLFENTGI